MDNHNKLDNALSRVMSISWEHNPFNDSSNVRMLREYFRRAALWAKKLNCLTDWPFFDVVEYVVPHIVVDERIISLVDQHLRSRSVHSRMSKTCKWFLRWSLAYNCPELQAFHLPSLYEPVIRMYEQGGSFYSEHGFFYVGSQGFSRGLWQEYDQEEPFTVIEDK